jgi:hypothetical protein
MEAYGKREREPGSDNEEAKKIAQRFWLATTGRSDSGWKDHFTAAKRLAPAPARRNKMVAKATDERAKLVAEVQMLLLRRQVCGLSGQNEAN